jgi:hypothetical protein
MISAFHFNFLCSKLEILFQVIYYPNTLQFIFRLMMGGTTGLNASHVEHYVIDLRSFPIG